MGASLALKDRMDSQIPATMATVIPPACIVKEALEEQYGPLNKKEKAKTEDTSSTNPKPTQNQNQQVQKNNNKRNRNGNGNKNGNNNNKPFY